MMKSPPLVTKAFVSTPFFLTRRVYPSYTTSPTRPPFYTSRRFATMPRASTSENPVSSPRPRGNTLVLVGLGNPGPRFEGTRHNIGFDVVDAFAARHGGQFSTKKNQQADIAVVEVNACTIHVVKPRTFMNVSGNTVKEVLKKTNAPDAALMVVVDDMSLEVGRLRLRPKGSAGGHNGLKHIEARLGSREYARLKVGVGSPRLGAQEWKDHVLGKFSRNEQKLLEEVTLDCMDVLDMWVRETDLPKVMNLAGTLSAKKK